MVKYQKVYILAYITIKYIKEINKNNNMAKECVGYKVPILGNKCYRCNHAWRPLNLDERPIVCPKCKSPYWWKPRQKKNKKINKSNK